MKIKTKRKLWMSVPGHPRYGQPLDQRKLFTKVLTNVLVSTK